MVVAIFVPIEQCYQDPIEVGIKSTFEFALDILKYTFISSAYFNILL